MLSQMETGTASARRVLQSRFGFDSFRPGQERVIEALLAGRSALAVFPTGAGKSLCYQLPALMLDGVTVVVSPLIALMKDQIDALVRQGVDAARLDSSIEQAEARDVSARLRTGSLKLLYVAPERFNNERFLAQLAPDTDLAVRRRRGPLHLRVGAQLPAGLPQARRTGA
jgi:ATP-dependent DNA helicase RecQ